MDTILDTRRPSAGSFVESLLRKPSIDSNPHLLSSVPRSIIDIAKILKGRDLYLSPRISQSSVECMDSMIGLLWSIFGFSIWLYAFNKVCFPKDIHEEFDKETGKRIARRVVQSDIESDALVGYRFMFAIFFFAILCTASMMFFGGGW